MFNRLACFAHIVVWSAVLVFGMAGAPHNAWAQQPVSSQTTSVETWKGVKKEFTKLLTSDQNSLVKAVKQQIATLTAAIVEAIQTADTSKATIALAETKNATDVATYLTQQSINTAANIKMLEYKQATTPQRADCIRADNAIQNSQAALTNAMAASALNAQNVAALSGKPPISAKSANFVAQMNNPRFGDAYTVAALYQRIPPGTGNTGNNMSFVAPENKTNYNLKAGEKIPGGADNLAMSVLNPSAYLVDNTTLQGDGTLLTENFQVIARVLCGGGPPAENAQAQVETATGMNQFVGNTTSAMKRSFCHSYLAKLFNLRLPKTDAEAGQKAVARILANYEASKITDTQKQQVAMHVGTMGALSIVKSLSLYVEYLNSPNFLNDAANNPAALGKNLVETIAYDAKLSHAITEELQYQTMLHALAMKQEGRS